MPHQECLKHALDVVDKIIQLGQKRRAYQKPNVDDKTNYEMREKEHREIETIFNLERELFYIREERLTKKILNSVRC